MPFKEFFEQYPLYKKFTGTLRCHLDSVPRPTLNMKCDAECKGTQTFVLQNAYDMNALGNRNVQGQILRAVYACVGCQGFKREFFFRVDDDGQGVRKVGQYPPWDIAPESDLVALLGGHVDFYKRGLVCESQGCGIGAFAYYRRIVEEVIDDLLDSVAALISPEDLPRYQAALEQTKTTIVAQDKIELVKDLLPPILRPEGHNPLSLLHSLLSAGLHGRTDEECLEDAGHIRDTLVFLVNQIARSRESAKQFTASMKKLLEKKSKVEAPAPAPAPQTPSATG